MECTCDCDSVTNKLARDTRHAEHSTCWQPRHSRHPCHWHRRAAPSNSRPRGGKLSCTLHGSTGRVHAQTPPTPCAPAPVMQMAAMPLLKLRVYARTPSTPCAPAQTLTMPPSKSSPHALPWVRQLAHFPLHQPQAASQAHDRSCPASPGTARRNSSFPKNWPCSTFALLRPGGPRSEPRPRSGGL